jgi:hypothetical protein
MQVGIFQTCATALIFVTYNGMLKQECMVSTVFLLGGFHGTVQKTDFPYLFI